MLLVCGVLILLRFLLIYGVLFFAVCCLLLYGLCWVVVLCFI